VALLNDLIAADAYLTSIDSVRSPVHGGGVVLQHLGDVTGGPACGGRYDDHHPGGGPIAGKTKWTGTWKVVSAAATIDLALTMVATRPEERAILVPAVRAPALSPQHPQRLLHQVDTEYARQTTHQRLCQLDPSEIHAVLPPAVA
jgi:hypothetical protein